MVLNRYRLLRLSRLRRFGSVNILDGIIIIIMIWFFYQRRLRSTNWWLSLFVISGQKTINRQKQNTVSHRYPASRRTCGTARIMYNVTNTSFRTVAIFENRRLLNRVYGLSSRYICENNAWERCSYIFYERVGSMFLYSPCDRLLCVTENAQYTKDILRIFS